MGLYRDWILPWGMNLAMNLDEHRRLRARAVEPLAGEVLEIGFGSGLNLPHLPPGVTRLYAVDPATLGRRLAGKRLRACSVPVEFVGLDGEELPLADASVDHVLSTWTLCTIPNLPRALAEVRRVLRPGGTFRFLEHGLSEDPRVARWQHRLNGLQMRFAGGCQLALPIDRAIRDAGFELDELENFLMKGPQVACTMYMGTARH